MRQILIATVVDSVNRTTDYRILAVETGNISDINKREAYKLVSKLKVDGLDTYGKYQLIGSNGSIDNYSIIKDGVLSTTNKLVILDEVYYGDDICGYKVCDCFGNISIVTKEFMYKYIQEKGIANGIIIDGGIRPFTGEYTKIQVIKEDKYELSKDSLRVNVVEQGNKLVYSIENKFGSINGYKLSDKKNIFWIDYLRIHSKYRKRGIGTQLYIALEEYVKQNGIATVTMLGVSENIATELFRKQGYKVLEYTNDNESLPESAILSKKL